MQRYHVYPATVEIDLPPDWSLIEPCADEGCTREHVYVLTDNDVWRDITRFYVDPG